MALNLFEACGDCKKNKNEKVIMFYSSDSMNLFPVNVPYHILTIELIFNAWFSKIIWEGVWLLSSCKLINTCNINPNPHSWAHIEKYEHTFVPHINPTLAAGLRQE